MGLTDLFKSKAPKLEPDPSIRWFGKLPTYADYYRSKTNERWAVEFNDWVLKGFEVYQRRRSADGNRPGRLPLAAVILRLPESGMTVFASIQDYGGDMRGRPFPLCFYAGVPTEQWTGPTSRALAPALRTIRDLAALRREVPRFLNSPGRFESQFGEREVDLSGIDGEAQDDTWLEQARKIPLADWVAAARAVLNTENADDWLGEVERKGEQIAKRESKSFEPTLRFPLAIGLPIEVQAAGWLRWLQSRMDLRRRSLSLMFSGELDRAVGHFSVVARVVDPEDFLLISSAADTLSCADDFSNVGQERVEGRDEPEPGTTSGSAAPAGSWADFVERVAIVT